MTTDLREAKAAFKAEFGRAEGIEGVGIGDGRLRVYVRDEEAHGRVPSEFRGVPVEVVVTGEIRISG